MTRDAFKALVETRLTDAGFKPGAWRWLKGAGLIMIVNGTFRDLPLRANMKRTEFERWMGRCEGWADMLGLGAA